MGLTNHSSLNAMKNSVGNQSKNLMSINPISWCREMKYFCIPKKNNEEIPPRVANLPQIEKCRLMLIARSINQTKPINQSIIIISLSISN